MIRPKDLVCRKLSAIQEILLVKTPKRPALLVREYNPILNLSTVYVKIFYRVVDMTTTLTTDFHF